MALPCLSPRKQTVYDYLGLTADPSGFLPQLSYPSSERRQAALDLVNQFYRQIRYGCQNPACNTPTCLSCRKRCANGPYRRATILTARALASFLASEENADQKLCPHPPNSSIQPQDRAYTNNETLSSPLLRGDSTARAAAHGVPRHESLTYRLQPRLLEVDDRSAFGVRSREKVSRQAKVSGVRDSQEQTPIGNGMSEAEKGPAFAKEKDPKSLTQNIFDTQAFKCSKLARERCIPSVYNVTLEPLFYPIFSTMWSRLSTIFPSVTNNKQALEDEVMHGQQAAEVFNQALKSFYVSFVASVASTSRASWDLFVKLHRSGQYVPNKNVDRILINSVLEMMGLFKDELALRLAAKLARAFAALRCWDANERHRILFIKNLQAETWTGRRFTTFRHLVVKDLKNPTISPAVPSKHGKEAVNSEEVPYAAVVLEWMRSVILHEWDGKAIYHRYGAVGGAVDFMSLLYEQRYSLGLSEDSFSMPFLSDRLDTMETPVEWSTWQSSKENTHLLSSPFLFTPATLVTYLRALNYASMVKAFEEPYATSQLMSRISAIARTDLLDNKLKVATSTYLVLEIRRDSILTDAMNQLWRRQKRELLRPLKIRMGMEEGEEGVDHGGVQQEFFRIAFAEALNPDYGMFTTDRTTQMSWFRVCTLEPEYKYELLGLLVSLAVYNGLTLPVNFPLVLYRKLLQFSVMELDHIQDGWPELTKGLSQLLSWSDGDVADVFMRSYVFSAETIDGVAHVSMERYQQESAAREGICAFHPGTERNSFGTLHTHDSLDKRQSASSDLSHPSSSSSEDRVSIHHSDPHRPNTDSSSKGATNSSTAEKDAQTQSDPLLDEPSMVTNANRKEYIKDYIYWLTDRSVRRQYEAFARGFYHCLDKNTLQIFTPEAFRDIVEGGRNISVDELEATTKYENGYNAQHRVIKDFWFVVRSFSVEQVQKLLEFVTASDRVPVKGISSMVFIVQRNGTNDERLPTTLTCFGRLLLPEYSTREILQEKLGLAIENSKGFGVA